MENIGVDIQRAISVLDNGGVVAIPTETVYGLAANALNEDAVRKIFQIKERPEYDPLIVHTNKLAKVDQFLKFVPEKAKILAEKFWPGPLTIIFECDNIPSIVTSGLNTVGIRVPNHPLTLSLLEQIDYPLAAPSANPFGYVSPTCAMHVYDMLGDKVDYILDGGNCNIGLESTIISFCTNYDYSYKDNFECEQYIYRVGGIAVEHIEDIIGEVKIQQSTSKPNNKALDIPPAPGMLESHYAPKIPLFQGDIKKLLEQHTDKKVILITYSEKYNAPNIVKHYDFSDDKNESDGFLAKVAKDLFAMLRTSDKYAKDKANRHSKDEHIILAEIFPDKGLGRAINDRLRRASRNK